MFNDDTRIEFIDNETIIKKLCCERHRLIFYGILKLEDTFNIYTAYKNKPDFKEMLLPNQHHFISKCK